jgi:hypothetical protein
MKLYKKIFIFVSSAGLLAMGGCTKNFDAINTDPTQVPQSQFDPNLHMASTQVEYMNAIQGYNSGIIFESMWIQGLASAAANSYYSNGDKYAPSANTTTYQASLWTHAYNSAGYAATILSLTQGKPGYDNLRAMATIMQVLDLQTISDVYGDIPFTQALQAQTITQPVYDAQSAIYPALLARLDSVLPKLDATKPSTTNDLFYKGDVTKWKKFGYSLMLRMAMRLVKVDPATAEKYAEIADGKTFAGTADDAYVTFDQADNYNNNNGAAYQTGQDFVEVKWSKTFIDYLRSSNDPRLGVVAEVPQAGLKKASDETLAGDKTPANQLGLPNGYDNVVNVPGYPGATGTGDDAYPAGKYSRPSIDLYLSKNTPGYVINYAETELLLAEAAARGWKINSGSASAHFANGVTAAMQSLAVLSASKTGVDPTAIATYVAANPLDISSPANSINMINQQYWVTTISLFDFVEGWSNWRRTNVPALTPVVYPGNFSNSQIPRRQPYPVSEASNNPTNYSAAVGKLSGGDKFSGRVWWDK